MAINVRYGNVQDLGNMAVSAGEGRALWNRIQMEQQVANSIRDRYTAQDQITADRLQNIAGSRASRTPTTANRVQQVAGPFQRDIEQRKVQAPGGPGGNLDLSSAEQDALDIAMRTGNQKLAQEIVNNAMGRLNQPSGSAYIHGGGEGFSMEGGQIRGGRMVTDATGERQFQEIPQGDIQQRGGFVGPGQRQQMQLGQGDQTASEQLSQEELRMRKLQYLQQIGGDADPRLIDAMSAAVGDPEVGLNTFMIRTNQVNKQLYEGPRQRELKEQIDTLQSRRAALNRQYLTALSNAQNDEAAQLNTRIAKLDRQIDGLTGQINQAPEGKDPDVAALEQILKKIGQ